MNKVILYSIGIVISLAILLAMVCAIYFIAQTNLPINVKDVLVFISFVITSIALGLFWN